MKSLIKGYAGEKRLDYTGLDNRLLDGGKVIRPTHRSYFTLQ
jgi:hypothetical protein